MTKIDTALNLLINTVDATKDREGRILIKTV